VNFFVVKFFFSTSLESETALEEVEKDVESETPVLAAVMYGGLNKLWFHSAETTGTIPIESELENTEELKFVSIRSP
jgi:hypothetical protein